MQERQFLICMYRGNANLDEEQTYSRARYKLHAVGTFSSPRLNFEVPIFIKSDTVVKLGFHCLLMYTHT